MQIRSVDNNQHKTNKLLLATTTIAGSAIGGNYALTHLPDKTIIERDKHADFPQKYVKSLMKSFDMKKAEKEAAAGNLSQEAHETIKDIHSNLNEILQKQLNFAKIDKKPAQKYTDEWKTALKEANSSFKGIYSAVKSISVDLIGKMRELNIINPETMANTTKMAKENTVAVFKILAKPVGIGLAVGGVLGGLIGTGIGSLFHSNKNDN